MQTNIEWNKNKSFMYGILFTFFIAIIGYILAQLPGFNRIGPLATAIILAILYRQLFSYPKKIERGIAFSSKYILRLAIILYGLKLNVQVILDDGLGLLVKSLFAIALSIVLMYIFQKWWKMDKSVSFLLGVGTGICGAAAIAAVAPIIKAKSSDTAISIAIIALTGTIFSIIYTVLLPILPIDNMPYGIWSGLSLHELAHVALAAEPAGENALAFALLAKLSRVFLLVPFCFGLIIWLNMKNAQKNESSSLPLPYFLLGFVVMSIVGTYVLGSIIPFPTVAATITEEITTFLLASAMVGLGLNVDLETIRTKALLPFIAMIIVSIILAISIYFIVV